MGCLGACLFDGKGKCWLRGGESESERSSTCEKVGGESVCVCELVRRVEVERGEGEL